MPELWRTCQQLRGETGRVAFTTSFKYQGGAHVVCVLAVASDTAPQIVLSVGENPVAIKSFELRPWPEQGTHRGYILEEFLGDKYFSFRRALGIPEHGANGPAWSPKTIFESFEQQLPHLHIGNYDHRDARRFIDPSTVENADQIYFCGWHPWGRNSVSAENLAKSELMLGGEEPHIRAISLEANSSTRWSANPAKERAFHLPGDR